MSLLIGLVGVINVDTTYAASKKKIRIESKTVSMTVGGVYQQRLLNKKGKAINKKVTWKSKNTGVAQISKKGGFITAVGIGTAGMTAKYKGKTYKFTVVVTEPAVVAPTPAPTPTPPQNEEYIMTDASGISIFFDDSYDARLCKVSFSDPTVARVKSTELFNDNKLVKYLVRPYKNGKTDMTIVNEYTGQTKTVSITVSIQLCSVYSPYSLPTTINYSNQTVTVTSINIGETYFDPDVYMDPNTQMVNIRFEGTVEGTLNLPIKFYDQNGNVVGTSTLTPYNNPSYSNGVFYREAIYAIKSGTTGPVELRLGE